MTWGRGPGVWLLITAVFELLMAAFFLVLGILIPEVLFGFGLTAGILGLVGLFLLVWAIRARARHLEAERVRATGRFGQATVTGLNQTGIWINNNPVVAVDLLVDVPGTPPYPVTLRETVPQILLARLGSGAPLPVKVDRADPTNVVIDWRLAGPVAPAVAPYVPAWAPAWTPPPPAWTPPPPGAAPAPLEPPLAESGAPAEPGASIHTVEPGTVPLRTSEDIAAEAARRLADSRLRAIGRRATATLVGAFDTGTTVDGQRVFELALTVRPGAAEPYQVRLTAPVPSTEIPGLTPGAPLPVRIDPADPKQLVMDWHRVE